MRRAAVAGPLPASWLPASRVPACRVVGQGHPLLLVHGWGVTHSVWRHLEPELAPHLRLVQVELPGLGGSPWIPAETFGQAGVVALRALREHLGITRWSVLGYSAGAGVVSRYVHSDRAAVDSAIWLCPLLPLGIYRAFIPAQRFMRRAWPGPELWLSTGWRLRWLTRVLAFNTVRAGGASGALNEAAWHAEISGQPPKVLWAQFGDMFDRNWRHQPQAVRLLRIWGTRDRIVARPRRDLGVGDRFVAGGHTVPIENPAAVARLVLDFVTRGSGLEPGTPQAGDDVVRPRPSGRTA